MDTTLLKTIIYGILRASLASVSTWLIEHGITTQDGFDKLLMGLIGAAIVVVSTIYNKVKVHKAVTNKNEVIAKKEEAIDVALSLPSGSTRSDLHEALRS